MGRDYYAILGVPKGTSDEDVLKKGTVEEIFYDFGGNGKN